MEMAEVPLLVGHQFFQAVQELGGFAAFNPLAHIGHRVDKAGRRRMGDDVIDGEIMGRQVLGGIVEDCRSFRPTPLPGATRTHLASAVPCPSTWPRRR